MGDTGLEPVTSSVSRKYSTAELIALAEGEGFEPSEPVSRLGSLANCCLKPLGHPSKFALASNASCRIRTHNPLIRSQML